MILGYHQIVTEDCRYLYSVDSGLFEQHMAALQSMESEHLVTFDDGYLSQGYVAAPLLERYSAKGCFFITGAWVGQDGYMSWTDLKELHRNGHHIGAHGWSHKMLTQCTAAELREEVSRPKDVLEQRLGAQVSAISCPGGAWDSRVARACAEAGYSTMYTSDAWTRHRRVQGVDVAGRLMMRRGWAAADLKLLIAAERKPYAPVRLRSALSRAVRRTLGVRLYHVIWCFLAGWTPSDDLEGSRVAAGKGDYSS